MSKNDSLFQTGKKSYCPSFSENNPYILFCEDENYLQVLRMLGVSQMKNITKMRSHAGKRYGFIGCYFSREEFHVKNLHRC